MRPVQYIEQQVRACVQESMESTEIQEHLKSDLFQKAFKEKYPYRSYNEEIGKLNYEWKTYGKVLDSTLFRCVYGEDGSLQYYHMCQKCGNILHDPHDEWNVTEHDMMCPTCNGVDVQRYPYKTILRGSGHWIHLVRGAAFNDKFNEENPEHAGYVAGSAKDLAYTVTPWMNIKWWFIVQWSRVKHYANIIQHPKKHIEAIKKRNAWREEMKAK